MGSQPLENLLADENESPACVKPRVKNGFSDVRRPVDGQPFRQRLFDPVGVFGGVEPHAIDDRGLRAQTVVLVRQPLLDRSTHCGEVAVCLASEPSEGLFEVTGNQVRIQVGKREARNVHSHAF